MTTARLARAALLLPVAGLLAACEPAADPDKTTGTTDDTVDDGSDGGDGTDGGDGSDGGDEVAVATELLLTVDNAAPAVGDTVQLTVTVLDQDGGAMSGVPVEIGVAPETGSSYAAGLLTIEAEGVYTITATAPDAGLSATATVTADGSGPWIQISSPARGQWVEAGATVTVSGTVTDGISAVDHLLLNGESLEVAEDGSFSKELTVPDGAHRLTLETADSVGNQSDVIIGGMAGAQADPDTWVSRGIVAHLGQGGLDALGAVALSSFTPALIEDALVANNPLVSGSYSCALYNVRASDFTFTNPVVTIVPQSGSLLVTLAVDDMELGLSGSTNVCGASRTINGAISDSHVEIEMELELTVPFPGVANAEIVDTTTTFTDLQVDVGSLSTLLSSFGLTLSDLGINFESIIASEVEAYLPAAVEPEIESALGAVAFAQSFDLLGNSLDLEGRLGSIVVDADGLAIGMFAITDGPAAHPDAPELAGVLALSNESPAWSLAQDAELGLQANTINTLLHRAVVAGALNLEISATDLGLEPEVIDSLFPGATTLDLSFAPLLPPVVQPGESDTGMVLVVPSLQVEAWGEVDGLLTRLTVAAVQVHAGVALVTDGSSVGLEFVDLEAAVDVIPVDGDEVAAAEVLEETLQGVATALVGDLLPALSLDLPPVGDLSLTPTGGAAGGSANTWMVIEAEVD